MVIGSGVVVVEDVVLVVVDVVVEDTGHRGVNDPVNGSRVEVELVVLSRGRVPRPSGSCVVDVADGAFVVDGVFVHVHGSGVVVVVVDEVIGIVARP